MEEQKKKCTYKWCTERISYYVARATTSIKYLSVVVVDGVIFFLAE